MELSSSEPELASHNEPLKREKLLPEALGTWRKGIPMMMTWREDNIKTFYVGNIYY